MGIARFLSIPTCTFQSRRSVPSEALAHVPSLFVMTDEESVHVLSLKGIGCVIAVEARELLAERGRARQTAGGMTFPCVPRCFKNSNEDAGKLSFYYIPPPPPPTRPAMPMIMDISVLFTRIFFFERILLMVLPLLTCSHYHVL